MRLSLIAAAAGLAGLAFAAPPARADWDDHDGWRRHEYYEHQWHERREAERWREHEWRERHWRAYYAPPPVYEYGPPRAY